MLEHKIHRDSDMVAMMRRDIISLPEYNHRFVLPKEVPCSVGMMIYKQLCEFPDMKCRQIDCILENGKTIITVNRKNLVGVPIAKAERSPTDWEIARAQEIYGSLMAGASSDPEENPCLKWKLPHDTQEFHYKSPYIVAALLSKTANGLKFEGKMDTAYGLGVNDLAVVIVCK